MAPRPGSRTDPFPRSSSSSLDIEAATSYAREIAHSSSDFTPSTMSSSSLSAFEKTQKQHERRQRRERQIQQMEMAIEASGRSLDRSFASLNAEIDGFASVGGNGSGSVVSPATAKAIGPGEKIQKSKEDWSAPALSSKSAREFLEDNTDPQPAGEGPTKRRTFGYDKNVSSADQRNLQGVSLYGGGAIPEESNGGSNAAKGAGLGTAFGWMKDKLTFGNSGGQASGEYGSNNLAPRGTDGGNASFKSVDLRPRGYDESRPPGQGTGNGSSNGGGSNGHGARRFMTRVASNAAMTADTLAMCMSKRCACVIAAIAIAGITAGVVTSNNAAAAAANEASVSAASERSGADLSPAEMFDFLKSRILDEKISHPKTLENKPRDSTDPHGPRHPQYLALKWLSESPANSELNVRSEYALQRYALAVFYHSTYDAASRLDELDPPSRDDEEWDNWDADDKWMSGEGICSWLGVQCHHRTGTSNMDTTYNKDGVVTYLKLPANEIRGPLPRELFTALTDLRVLDLKQNGINGTLPTEIGLLSQLEYLQMDDNYMEGSIPSEIGLCTELRQVHLSENWLEGTIPEEISQLKKLTGLGLFHNGLSGTVPFILGELTELKNLYLDENNLESTIPPSLGLLHNLGDLRLGKNDLTGPIPVELSNLASSLEILYLHSNLLTGTIPTELAQLSKLDELYLYKNYNLTGALPTEFGTMTDLDHLYLDHCDITGTIPSQYGNMDNLQQLYLYGNELTGTIPSELGDCAQLNKVNLGENGLTGPLPAELGKLVKLERLSLENNELTGNVPPSFGGLHKMDKLTLHGNSLSGLVPPEVCDLTRSYGLEEFSMDCAAPTEGGVREVSCDCCTKCVSDIVVPEEA